MSKTSGSGGRGVAGKNIASTDQAMEAMVMQAYGAPPEHIARYLSENGIEYIEAYHITNPDKLQSIRENGVRMSSQDNRRDATYFFLDRSDIARNANNLGYGHNGTNYGVVTIRIPRSEAAYMAEDGLYNGFISSRSAARLFRNIPADWIHSTATRSG